MALRLEDRDEGMHAVEEASNFQESMYFNFYDPKARLGGFFRIGNRPNEGYAEMTTCLYLPDGRAGFMFSRPKISSNDSFDAGGMRFGVREPFRRLTVTYDGTICLLSDPLAMADPKRAFGENPHEPCAVRLDVGSASPAFGGEPSQEEAAVLSDFARGHYEQHIAVSGTVAVEDAETTVQGFGLRDHSWGPRFWQNPWWYRWMTANAGADAGFAALILGSEDGSRRVSGMWLKDGKYTPIDDMTMSTTWSEPDCYHQEIRLHIKTASGEHAVEGRVLSLVPLRNRRQAPDGAQLVTRISEGMTEWRFDDHVGYGLSEYLDQIRDGRPVGIGV